MIFLHKIKVLQLLFYKNLYVIPFYGVKKKIFPSCKLSLTTPSEINLFKIDLINFSSILKAKESSSIVEGRLLI